MTGVPCGYELNMDQNASRVKAQRTRVMECATRADALNVIGVPASMGQSRAEEKYWH
jgi:hypothetical protein